MPIVTLRDLYAADLSDLLDAEQQIEQELPAMAARATSGDLRQAFDDHLEKTRVHIERLTLLFRRLDEAPGEHACEAIRGLIQDHRRRSAETERGEVLDAALIAAAQRIDHYEIAAYGCLHAYARTLGDDEAARMLQQTLDEEGDADHRLSHIAEHGINQGAGADILDEATMYRSRLRYVAAGDLREFSYREYRVSNGDAEDLGALDGFIVDERSGLPVYFVVDSGGWFAGRRYVVPVAALQPDDTARLLRTDLTRDTLRRYPEFSPAAFTAMDDDAAHNYERRLLELVAASGQAEAARRQEHVEAHEDPPATKNAEIPREVIPPGAPVPRGEGDTKPQAEQPSDPPAARIEQYRER